MIKYLFKSINWCGYVFWGKKTTDDNIILISVNLEPFFDVTDPKFCPNSPNFGLHAIKHDQMIVSM